MDETQKRKITAKEFIEQNRNIGFAVIIIFVLLFMVYFSFIYFYSKNQLNSVENTPVTSQTDNSFGISLLPTFSEYEGKEPTLDSDFLGNFSTGNISQNVPENEGGDNSKLVKIESDPTLGYIIFDKPVSIKNYIKNKPKVCTEKVEVVTKKETKSTAVKTFQDMLRSIDEYSDTPNTEILDEKTREKIYIFQKRYADILYKNKSDKTPTRLIDKETVHFLNLLCDLDPENKDDFVQVPTLRYARKIDRAIFDYNTETKEKVRIESKTATNTEEVVFSRKGEYLVFRRDNRGVLESDFYNVRTKNLIKLQDNITTMDFNDNNLLVFGVPTDIGLTIKTYDEGKNVIKTVAQIPLNEWNLFWLSNTEIGISSKPSAYAEGIYMALNTTTKKLRQLTPPLLGLSVQKTSIADFTILSTGGAGQMKTLLLNNKTRNIGDLGVSTFAEKCSQTVFAGGVFCAVPKTLDANKIYPDDWYKGKTISQDVLFYKSISGTTTHIISYLEGRPISVLNLQVNKNGIFFIDESSLNLYSLEL